MRLLGTALLLLLGASASLAVNQDGWWGTLMTSWFQRANVLRDQLNTVRDNIKGRLERLDTSLNETSDVLSQIFSPELAEGIQRFMGQVICLADENCSLLPSSPGRHPRQAIADLERTKRYLQTTFTSEELAQARALLLTVNSRVRRDVLFDTSAVVERIGAGLDEALSNIHEGVQQARAAVENVRGLAKAHVSTARDRVRDVLRCWLAFSCPSQRRRRSLEQHSTGLRVVKRYVSFGPWRYISFDAVRDLTSSLVNSRTVEDVDTVVNRVHDFLQEKIDELACLVQLSC